MTDLTKPLRDFVAIFESHRIPYVLMGGMAVAAHGLPRPTHDVDFTIVLPREQLADLFDAVTQAPLEPLDLASLHGRLRRNQISWQPIQP